MALTILQSYKTINLSRHLFFLRLQTNSYVLSPASKASALISFSQLVTTEGEIAFAYSDNEGDGEVKVRFRNTPTESYDIPIQGGSAPTTTALFAQAVIDVLSADFRFMNAFDVGLTLNTSTLFISSINYSSQLFLIPGAFNAAFSITVVNNQSSVSSVKEDFKLITNLFLYTNQFQTKKIDTQNHIPQFTEGNLNLNANAEVDFTAIAELQHPPEVIPGSDTEPFIHENALRRYRITAAEYYDGDFQDFEMRDNIYSLDAEINYAGYDQGVSEVATFCDSLLQAPYKFLTFLEKYKLSYYKDNLYWISILIPKDVSFKVIISAVSSESGASVPAYESNLITNNTGHPKVFRVPCGINIIKPNWDADLVHSYKVYLVDGQDEVISQEFIIEVDQRYLGDEKTFVYKNNFGVYHLFRAKGEFEVAMDVEFEQVQTSRRIFSPTHAFETKNVDVEKVQEVSCKIGNQNTIENKAMAEFLFSKEVYELLNGNYYPIVLDKSKNVMQNNLENLQNMEFKYKYSTDKLID